MTNKPSSLKKNILLLFISIIVSLLFLEGALRIVLPTPIVWNSPQESYDFDSIIGHKLKPNQQAFTHDKVVTTNSIGLRDREYTSKPAAGGYRVLALGDSQTFGNGLELKDTWPKQLEHELNLAKNSKEFEVINSGIPGSDTWQHEIIFNRMIDNYHPDAAVLAFYVNDVVKTFTPNHARSKARNESSGAFVHVLKRSALLLTLRQVYSSFQKPKRSHLKQQALLNNEVDDEIIERWLQVEKSLASMKQTADKYDMVFFVASLPRRDQVMGSTPWDGYNKNLEMITEKLGITMLSMKEPLAQGYKTHQQDLFIAWDGHNSVIANHIIAQKMTTEMLKQIK